MTQPHVDELVDDSGRWWVVEGLGMQFKYSQRWQAEVQLHCLQSASGSSTGASRPLYLDPKKADDETS